MQWLADPLQVKQLELQFWQVLSAIKIIEELQEVQIAAVPEHSLQLELHCWHE